MDLIMRYCPSLVCGLPRMTIIWALICEPEERGGEIEL